MPRLLFTLTIYSADGLAGNVTTNRAKVKGETPSLDALWAAVERAIHEELKPGEELMKLRLKVERA